MVDSFLEGPNFTLILSDGVISISYGFFRDVKLPGILLPSTPNFNNFDVAIVEAAPLSYPELAAWGLLKYLA